MKKALSILVLMLMAIAAYSAPPNIPTCDPCPGDDCANKCGCVFCWCFLDCVTHPCDPTAGTGCPPMSSLVPMVLFYDPSINGLLGFNPIGSKNTAKLQLMIAAQKSPAFQSWISANKGGDPKPCPASVKARNQRGAK